MDDPALVRMMHRVAYLDHQFQLLPRVQLVLIAYSTSGLPWISSIAKNG